MNKAIVSGRVVGEPRYNQGKTIVNFSVNSPYYDKREGGRVNNYVPVTLVGKAVELFEKHFGTGKAVEVEGEWRHTSYEKDGSKIYTDNLVAFNLGFVPKDKEGTTRGGDVTTEDIPF